MDPKTLLGQDVLPYVMGVVPPSRRQIEYLRELRLVCKDFNRAVAFCVENEEWMRPLTQDAADFRGDVAMTGIVKPPFSLNRGIERLLRAGNLHLIGSGMRDHILDSTTQEFLIQRLRKSLAPPLTQARIGRRRAASEFVTMQTVAWAMRVHSTNRQIQIDGIHLMSYMTHDPAPDDTIIVLGDGWPTSKLSAYIIDTVAVLMHDNLAVLDVQRACLKTLANVLLEIDGWVNDDVVIDLFALIQNDTHNMLALVVRVINAHGDDYHLQLLATGLLHTYLCILNRLEDVEPMPDFIVHEVESAILTSMHRQLHSAGGRTADEVYASVQQNCIFVLEQLMQYDFAGMHRVADFMQYTINAAMCNIWELAEDMERVYLDIMHRLDASGSATPLQMQRLQNIGASSGMMQISVSFMHNCVRAGTLRGADSDAHKMLLKICTGNAATTALMVQADVVRSIDEASQNVHKSRAWLAIREEVIALLRLGGGIAPVHAV